MTDKAIIQGSLVDVRNVNQHKCVRMLIDVPAEHAPMVMEAFGWPTMASPVPVAIARLQSQPAERSAAPKIEKPKQQWHELARAQQAGIACNDPDFRRFLARHGQYHGILMLDLDMAADEIRQTCGIKSRVDLNVDHIAADKWDKLYGAFQMWKRGAAA